MSSRFHGFRLIHAGLIVVAAAMVPLFVGHGGGLQAQVLLASPVSAVISMAVVAVYLALASFGRISVFRGVSVAFGVIALIVPFLTAQVEGISSLTLGMSTLIGFLVALVFLHSAADRLN